MSELMQNNTLADMVECRGKLSANAYEAYADGSSLGNPGPAGWASLVIGPDGKRTIRRGGVKHATNNQMELWAAIMTARSVPKDTPATLWLDSEYVVKAANVWRDRWEGNGWRTAKGRAVENAACLRELFVELDQRPLLRLDWVKAHSGSPENESVDCLARGEAEKVKMLGEGR